MKRNFNCISVTAAVLLLICCSPKVSSPKSEAAKPAASPSTATAAATPAPAADAMVIAAGHEVYEGRCGRCHQLYDISAFSEEEWGKIIPSMSKKARLTDDEHYKLTAYIFNKRRSGEVKKG